jgi:DNA-binding beta-propeller fold protein YncE
VRRAAARRRARAYRSIGLALIGAFVSAGCGRGADGGSLYVTSGRTDEIVRLDASDGHVIRRIATDRMRHESDEPHAIALDPAGRFWYASVAHGEPSLWKFETGSDRLVGRVDLPSGGAAMIGMTADGTTAFVPDYDRAGEREGHVAAIRLHDLHVIAHAPVCVAPHDAAVHPDGRVIAIACAGSDEVVLLDPTLQVRLRIRAPAMEDTVPVRHPDGHMPTGGTRPLSVAWSPDGETLAVALHAADRVWLLDRAGATRALVDVGGGPAQLAFLDDRRIVTANRMGGSMSIVQVDGSGVTSVALPIELPHGITVANGVAYVACEGSTNAEGGIVAVDLETRRVLWQRRVGRYVLAVAFAPDSDR